MNAVTIRLKMFIVFGVLTALALIQGVFAINRLSAVNEIAREMESKWLQGSVLVSAMATGLSNIRVAEAGHIVWEESSEVIAAEGEITDRVRAVEALVAQYAPLAETPEQKKLLAAFKDKFDQYKKVQAALTDTSLAADKAGALAIFRGEAKDAFEAASQTLQAMVEAKQSEATEASDHGARIYAVARLAILAVLAVSVALALGAGTLVVRTVSRPIASLTGAMRRLADGDTSIDLPERARKDELGAMAEAVGVFKQNKLQADELTSRQAAEQEAREKRTARLEDLLNGFDSDIQGVLSGVNEAVEQMQSVSREMTTIAEDTTVRAENVASAADEASSNVEAVASAAEELSASIAEIGRQVEQSSQAARSAVEEAGKAATVIDELSETSQKIGDVVQLITDIASQTNLLALNATIEAARAGDAGKGFAVVANEVKALATQTGKATDDISRQIASVQQATRGAVGAIEIVNQTIGTISGIAADIAAGVQEQAAATREIAGNVDSAARGTQDVTGHIRGVQEAAGEAGHQAHDVLVTSDVLRRQADGLQNAVRQFLADVRTA